MIAGQKRNLCFRWIFSLFVSLMFFITPTIAYAHASVVKSSPTAGQSLNVIPGKMQIWFDEAIQPNYYDLVVTSSDGNRVDNHDVHLAPSNHALLMCTIKQRIANGYYTAKWRGVSDDGHVISGSIPFQIGQQTEINVPILANPSMKMPPVYLAIDRWMEYLGLLLYTGLFVFWTFILPIQLRAERGVLARLFPLSTWLLNIATLAFTLSLPIQISIVTNKSILHIWHIQTFMTMLKSRFGHIWLWQMAILIMMFIALKIIRKRVTKNWFIHTFVLLASVILLVTRSISSHAIHSPYPAYSVIADVVHLIAASIWLGSLLGLTVLLPIGSVKNTINRIAYWETIRRFSLWGILTVLILAASGMFATYDNIPDVYTLLHTLYGRTFILKIVFVFIMLIFAIMHFVKGNKQGQTKRFTKTIGIEFSIGLCVLLVTSFLTNLPTPKATPGPFVNTQVLPDGNRITLRVTPNAAGVNDISVLLKSANGMMMTHILKASIAFTSLGSDTGTSNVPLAANNHGIYHLVGLYFPSAGRWYVSVHILINQTSDEYAHFEFLVGAPL